MKTRPTSLRPATEKPMTLEEIDVKMKKAEARRGVHQKTLAYIEKIKVDIDGPLWAHVKGKCKDLIVGSELLEDKADEYDPSTQSHPIPDRILWKSFGLKKAAKSILGVEDLISNEEGYRANLVLIEKEIKELATRKSKLG